MPRGVDVFNVDGVMSTLEALNHITVSFVPDKASANVLLMKFVGTFVEQELWPRVGPRVLFLADTCHSHSTHRTKAMLKQVKRHTMAHYRVAALNRHWHVRNRTVNELERRVYNRTDRHVGPAPSEGVASLRVFADILFGLDAEHYNRAGGNRSRFATDMGELCSYVNWCLVKNEWTHYCWDSTRQGPCCAIRNVTK